MQHSPEELARRIDQALGREPADLVVKDSRFLDVPTGEIREGDVAVAGDWIVGTFERYEGKREIDGRGLTVVPGFIDAHVHVESTMVTPDEFERCVLPRGTTTAICDPHEIANVLGRPGIRYFLDASERLAMDLFVQLSSCVPATDLETSGARLTAEDLLALRGHPSVIGLAEMMNFPGLLAKDPEVLAKLAAFSDGHIDGHCPLVTGRDLNAYAACGIRNCHESTTLEEAREKLGKGLQVLIREGSVSKDVTALAPLIDARTSPFVALCTDDRNPLDIAEEGHLDHLIRRAIACGAPWPEVYRAASWSAARGFGLTDRGLVAPGQRADLVLVEDLETCAVRTVLKGGRIVTEESYASSSAGDFGHGSIRLDPVAAGDFRIDAPAGETSVIGVVPGSILTDHLRLGLPHPDAQKVTVFARHGKNRNVGRGYVSGFGLDKGALASSVGHDSHNVIVVGATDEDMAAAVNRLIDIGGGFVAASGGEVRAEVALPIAGLLSDRPFEEVQDALRRLRRAVRELGCPLREPFLQLAFLPLPVIPHLKITDRGLVDVDRFEIVAA
ncbi:MAG: adenine deaminase [Planctomycetota bacterium]|jgi:adenine deaminase